MGLADWRRGYFQGIEVKIAPVTVTQMAMIGGVCVLGYMAYKAYKTVSSVSVSAVVADVVSAGATAVDARTTTQNPNELSLGGIQQAVSNAVQRGQDAGATNFFSAYFTGIFK